MLYYNYTLPIIGSITICSDGDFITNIYFKQISPPGSLKKEDNVIYRAKIELTEYLNSQRKIFSVPIKFNGTDFQKNVWCELLKIPYGETSSYGAIAHMLNNPKAARAVGMACNKNPIPIIVPCHRVLGISGSLVGYAAGLEIKEKLLDLER